jgi:hypothetical protein
MSLARAVILSEARGKQALFARQSPQKLKALRESALIESAVSSNRIEGVEADQARITTVIFGKGHLRDHQRAGKIVCLARGPGATWRKEGSTLK